MVTKKYVLRMLEYGYNDENYDFYNHYDDQKMIMAFDDQDTAIKAWKAIEKKTIVRRDFSQMRSFCESSSKDLLRLDQFLLEKAGVDLVYIFSEGDRERVSVIEGVEEKLAEIEEDVLFEFLQMAGLCSFFLNTFDVEDKLYVAYIPASGRYLVREDYYQSGHDGLAVSSTLDEVFLSICCLSYLRTRDTPLVLEGTLESLSDSPSILSTVIAANGSLSYDSVAGRLSAGDDCNALAAILPLLKQPPLEIRALAIDEFLKIQGVSIQ